MAVINMGTHILISHLGEPVNDLGDMSTELALWLEARLLDQKFREENEEDPEITRAKYQISTNQTILDMDRRAAQSAQRGYKPPYANNINRLTPLGAIKAQQARIVIEELNRLEHNICQYPDKWEKADDFIIKATIPARALKMLGIFNKAVIDAEQRLTDENALAVQAELIRRREQRLQKEQEEQTQTKTAIPSITEIEDVSHELALPDQSFDLVLLSVGENVYRAFIPIAYLREKAKTDLSYLIKYGLVDLKTYRDGSAGRPKHVVYPSKPGIKVFNHINNLGYLA